MLIIKTNNIMKHKLKEGKANERKRRTKIIIIKGKRK